MKKLAFVIFVLTTFIEKAFCQISDSAITSKEQSVEWLSNLHETKELEVQLAMLQHRVLIDTNLFIGSFGDRVFISTDTTKIKAECRLMLVVDSKLYYFTNDTDSKKIEEFTNYLTTEHIRSLKILEREDVVAIYGNQGACGLVSLKTLNRRTSRQLAKIFK